MKHIVQFSGGCASTYTAYLVSKEQKKEDIILLFHDTKVECKDSYRFRRQVSEYLDISITEVSDGRDLWEVIKDNNCLPSDRFPFCTRILKLEPAEKYLKGIKEPFILYNGFGREEWRRIQRSMARAERLNRVVKSPLYDLRISDQEVKRIIRDEWKICLPDAYKYLAHNNCIPCFKAGKGHFKAVAKYYPEEFEKACKAEEEIGYTVFTRKSKENFHIEYIDGYKVEIADEEPVTLRELHKEWDNGQLDLFSIEESIPCMCAI